MRNAYVLIFSLALAPARSLASEGTPATVINETFAGDLRGWWVEGGEKVWIEDGRLHVRADDPKRPGGAVCTVWCKTPHPADFELELDAHVVSSSISANNINLFFCFADPSGRPLWESRDKRSDAAYKKYHQLNGHIITFLNDYRAEGGRTADGGTKARIRIRRCPGFELMAETFKGRCESGKTYHLRVRRREGKVEFAVNGQPVLTAEDPNPLPGGLLGLRTFRTHLWWDNIRLRALK